MKQLSRLIMLGIVLGATYGLSAGCSSNNAQETEKVFTTACEAKIKGLDPAQNEDTYSAYEVSNVYEGLLEYHPFKRPHELMPNLAAAMPTISEDGCTYTFKLKQGVKFQDNACFPEGKGRELTAMDFVYTLKRVADTHVQAPFFALLEGKIKGLDQWRKENQVAEKADYQAAIEGLQALDKHTLRLTLNAPYPQFLHVLAMPFCYAVPKEAVEHYGEEFLNHPVGTGPFVLEAFNPQLNKLVYTKNPTFRKKLYPSEASEALKHLLADAGKPLPLVDKVVTYLIEEEQPRWLKFKKKQIELMDITNTTVALDIVQDGMLTEDYQNKGLQLHCRPRTATSFFVINNALPLFKHNLKLRQALSMAFDVAQHNQLFYNGNAVIAQSIIPPGLAGHNPAYRNPYRTYDVQQAKQLLHEAGYPAGKGLPTITIDTGAFTKIKQEAEFFQRCLEKIGIKARVVSNTWPELLKKIAKKETMLHQIAWVADYPDAQNFLSLLQGGEDVYGIGFYFHNAGYNKLYKQACDMPDTPARTVLYEQLNKMAGELVPCIYGVHAPRLTLSYEWIKNHAPSDFNYATRQYINIDIAKKKELQNKAW